ncbi:MAG TPA: response regulator transcription factor [Vicinamibacterales bacterium]
MESVDLAHTIRLVLVEDNRLLRDGLTALIDAQPDLEVVAAFGHGEHVLRKVHETIPHVLLLNVGVRDQTSLRLVQLVKGECAAVKLIVTDLMPTETDVIDFVQAGVSGFLLKEATCDDFLNAIRLVAGGTNVLPQALTRALFAEIVEQEVGETRSPLLAVVRLTKRERETVELIADGLSNKEIAQRLNVATFTVKTHVHNIFEKLALHTRVQVASYYSRAKASSAAAAGLAHRDQLGTANDRVRLSAHAPRKD